MPGVTIEQPVAHETLAQGIRGAFKAGGIYRVELPAQMLLYKVSDAGAVDPRKRVRINSAGFATPWWFSYESLSLRDPTAGTISIRGVVDVLENASRTGAGLRNYLRARGAVCLDWNAMTHLLVVKLGRPVVGLMGGCSGQPFYDDEKQRVAQEAQNLSFSGGEQQFHVPGLRINDVVVERFGTIV
jgi:hypothetical protein